ncbi:MAG: exodeoxyribonuclease VII large subunit, partial [Eggerthellaceae bacterium]|nr:exodeoxyribonuclease VII large subunit [Eggerthellaceae bacterium]
MDVPIKENAPLSVTQALNIARQKLEEITLSVMGEVCELSDKRGYKAVYFSIKDESSVLSCHMWLNRYELCDFKLELGMMVELTGRFTLYAAKGRMSFDVFTLNPAGEGRLRLMVANLAKKLESEGLMAHERKRAIPSYPEHIAVVTSPRGDAIFDVLRTLRRRFPLAKVSVCG